MRYERDGILVRPGQPTVRLQDVSVPRPGQWIAFVMDTGLCEGAWELAAGVDLLVCEATYAEAEANLARAHHHLTAASSTRIAARSGVRKLVITHFSQR